MCTSMTFQTQDFYFGRNMDLDGPLGERVVITPSDYPLEFRHEETMLHHYAMIGMAPMVDGHPLYAEAANEKGLCMAGLAFGGNARYADACETGKYNIATFELIYWILGACADVEEACDRLQKTCILSTAFAENTPPAELHWHIADAKRSVVLEMMADGMHIHENPVGVVTNNPPFSFHLTNLNCYMNVTAQAPQNRFSEEIPLKALGMGMGAMGLPGDASPVSRFVRGVFYKMNSVCDGGEKESVAQLFHILDGLAVVKGTARNPQGICSYTVYSCCINAAKGIYYYKTYDEPNIRSVSLSDCKQGERELIVIEPLTGKRETAGKDEKDVRK